MKKFNTYISHKLELLFTPRAIVGDLAMNAFSGPNALPELRESPITTYFGPSFVEDFKITPISKPLNSTISHTDKLETPEKDVAKAVLNYINSVLMDDEDFEDDALSIKASKLDSTKRLFHEIMFPDKCQDDNTETSNNKIVATEESAIHETLGKIVLMYGKTGDFTLTNFYCAFPGKGVNKREAIDMRNHLLLCMKFVASRDHHNANRIMKEIRSKSRAYGNGTERMAHYFTDALQVRLDGAEIPQHTTLAVKTLSDGDLLKSFKMFLTEFPFLETSYFFANEMIMDLVEKTSATTLHIIHFGIIHGLQWPPLIRRLSEMPGGPPRLRITGIDFPQPGFRPDARAKETESQLAINCKEFNVPFEYNSITKSWDTVKPEELKIKKDEAVAVNCMFHMMYLLDDSVMERNPRDTALNLIKTINPDIFVHVIVNGTYNSPFFISRFREALFHYSTWFEMADAVLPPESPERMVFEREVWGREVMNIVAREGLERVERPETYKQWQKRTIRAGFMPLQLNPNVVSDIQARLKTHYHKGFFVKEDGNWLLDCWKGRALFALSCWKPTA